MRERTPTEELAGAHLETSDDGVFELAELDEASVVDSARVEALTDLSESASERSRELGTTLYDLEDALGGVYEATGRDWPLTSDSGDDVAGPAYARDMVIEAPAYDDARLVGRKIADHMSRADAARPVLDVGEREIVDGVIKPLVDRGEDTRIHAEVVVAAGLIEDHRRREAEIAKATEKNAERLRALNAAIDIVEAHAERLGKDRVEWIINSVRNALSKLGADGKYEVDDEITGNRQREGIPVDGLIEALKELVVEAKESKKDEEDRMAMESTIKRHRDMLDYLNRLTSKSEQVRVYQWIIEGDKAGSFPAFVVERPDLKDEFQLKPGERGSMYTKAIELFEFLAEEAEGEMRAKGEKLKEMVEKSKEKNPHEVLIDFLEKHSKTYEEIRGLPEKWRKEVEARMVHHDFRKTGSETEDWYAAEDALKKRRELVLEKIPDVIPVPPITELPPPPPPPEIIEDGTVPPLPIPEEPVPPIPPTPEIIDDGVLPPVPPPPKPDEITGIPPWDVPPVKVDPVIDVDPIPPLPLPPKPKTEVIPEPKPELPPKTEKKEKIKEIIDLSAGLMKEIVSHCTSTGIMVEAMVRGDAVGRPLMRNVFDTLPEETQKKLVKELKTLGYSYEEFEIIWKKGGERFGALSEEVYSAMLIDLASEVKKRAVEKAGVLGAFKAGWRSALKQAILVGGVTAVISTGVGMVAGAAGALMSAIGFGGNLTKWLHDKGHSKKEQQKVQNKMDKIISDVTPEMEIEMINELLGDGAPKVNQRMGTLISQALRESSADAMGVDSTGVNAKVLMHNVRKQRAGELMVDGLVDAAAEEQLTDLMEQMGQRRDVVVEVAKINTDPTVIKVIENGYIRAKMGQVDVFDPEESKAKRIANQVAGYAAPWLVGGAVVMSMGAVGASAVRKAMAGTGLGYAGFRVGRKMDLAHQTKETMIVVKEIMDEVQSILQAYEHGTAVVGKDFDELEQKTILLEGHIRSGAISNSPLAHREAEGLVRESYRVLYEKRESEELSVLLERLQVNRGESEEKVEEDIKRLAKGSKWRRWVGAGLGLLGGVAMVAALEKLAEKPEKPPVAPEKPKVDPTRGGEPEVPRGRGGPEPTPPPRGGGRTDGGFDVYDPTYALKKGEGFWHAAEHLANQEKAHELLHGILQRHPNWEKLSDVRIMEKWIVEQAASNDNKFRILTGGTLYDRTLHAGAKFELGFEPDGYPSVHTIARPFTDHATMFHKAL